MLVNVAQGGRIETAGAALGSSTGTSVTADAAANTKGAFAQLLAASAVEHHAIGLGITVPASSTEDSNGLIDLAVGSTVFLADVPFNLSAPNASAARGAQVSGLIPILVPVGSQIRARIQVGSTNAPSIRAIAYGYGSWGNGSLGIAKATTYGISPATSRGTSVDAGGTAHTKGSWTELSASTARPICALVVVLTTASGTATNTDFLVDIGVGAASNEIVVMPNLIAWRNSSRVISPWMHGPFFLASPIAAGSRLVARMQAGSTNATARLLDIAVIGLG